MKVEKGRNTSDVEWPYINHVNIQLLYDIPFYKNPLAEFSGRAVLGWKRENIGRVYEADIFARGFL